MNAEYLHYDGKLLHWRNPHDGEKGQPLAAKLQDFILAIVELTGDDTHRVPYLRQPFKREPNFGVTNVNYDFAGSWRVRSGRDEVV